MNFKRLIPAALVSASVFGTIGLPLQAPAQPSNPPAADSANTTVPLSSQPIPPQLIQYQCYDNNGAIAFTTTNPQDTYGWAMGCREVPYVDEQLLESQTTYYRCYDTNGNIVLTTVDEAEVDRVSEQEPNPLKCAEIGHRSSSPIQTSAVYYECFDNQGNVAFATRFPQDTIGWKPGCREIVTRLNDLSLEAAPPAQLHTR